MGFELAYFKLRDKLLLLNETPKIYTSTPVETQPITEKLLRAIWFEQKYEKRNLKTTDGKKIIVVSPGNWNSDAGPDFKNAEFVVDGQSYAADVEIHRFASDWKKHGHHKDKNFDGVRLHVFFVQDKKDGGEMFQLCLANYLMPGIQLDLDDYPYQSFAGLGACGTDVAPSKFVFIEKLLDMAGSARIILRASCLSDDLDQELYSGLLEGLGYKENKEAMRTLSEVANFKTLRKILSRVRATEAAATIQAVLFGAGGFLESDSHGDIETEKLLSSYRSMYAQLRGYFKKQLTLSDWKFFRVRPPNYPQRRLYGASYIIDSAAKMGFTELAVSWLSTVGTLKNRAGVSRSVTGALEKILYVEPKGYFASRAKFGPQWSVPPAALLGHARARTILVNTVLPVLYRWSRENDQSFESTLSEFYDGLSALEPNRSTKKMAAYLLGGYSGRTFKIKKEKQAQGLIQIFQDFCGDKPHECKGCRLPEIMAYSLDELA